MCVVGNLLKVYEVVDAFNVIGGPGALLFDVQVRAHSWPAGHHVLRPWSHGFQYEA